MRKNGITYRYPNIPKNDLLDLVDSVIVAYK